MGRLGTPAATDDMAGNDEFCVARGHRTTGRHARLVVTGHFATTHYPPQIELGLMKLAHLVMK